MEAPQFTDLIRRHASLIHKIACAYCREAADREDVVQEIAVQLWRSRDRYDERYEGDDVDLPDRAQRGDLVPARP